jgi:hypothetical protein
VELLLLEDELLEDELLEDELLEEELLEELLEEELTEDELEELLLEEELLEEELTDEELLLLEAESELEAGPLGPAPLVELPEELSAGFTESVLGVCIELKLKPGFFAQLAKSNAEKNKAQERG